VSKVAQFGALLLSATILLAGNGLQTTLLPLRAEAEAFSALSIGVMGSSYFVGFVAGCLTAAALMRRVGHIRVFTGMAAIASVIPLIHILVLNEWSWWLLRAATGYCIASLFLVIESWLNERSDNTVRGAVFSIYTSLTFIAIITGQVLLTLYEPTGFAPFVLASIVISLAAVPVALNAIIAPAPPLRGRLRPLKLMRLSPAGTAGCLTAGLVSGAFWSLAPVAASNAGLDARGVAAFIGVTVLGGALSQWPFGRLSDRLDRRVVIVAASVLASAAGFLLFLATQHWSTAVLPLAFAFGAFTFPIYALSVAHANDLITEESFVEVSGGLLFLNGAGAVVGPLAGGLAMRMAGPGALFVAIAIACSLLAVFVVVRMRKVARPPEMHRADSVAAVDAGITAPVNFDPRVEPTDLGTGSR
jgi:MFS family permease